MGDTTPKAEGMKAAVFKMELAIEKAAQPLLVLSRRRGGHGVLPHHRSILRELRAPVRDIMGIEQTERGIFLGRGFRCVAQPSHIWFSHRGAEDTVFYRIIVQFSVNSVPL